MATAFSQQFQYTPYVENWDKDLLLKTLTYKQQNYDVNRQKVQNTLINTLGIDLAKGEDQDYLFGKLQEMTKAINEQGLGDLSLSSQTNYLQSYISSAADDNVLNGYLGTQKIRNIQKEAALAKEKGLYSDINFAYSMRDAEKWLSDGTAGSQYKGGSTYVPYADLNKKFLDVIKELKPDKWERQIKNGQWEYINEKGEVLSPADIKGAMELLISSDPLAAKQIEVNAWAQFRGMDDNTFFGNVKSSMNQFKQSYNNDIKQLQQQSLITKDPAKKQELDNLIKLRKDQLTQIDKLSTDRTSLENFLYKTQLFNNYAEVWNYSNVSQTFSPNETNFKLADMQYKWANLALEQEKLNLDKISNKVKANKEISEAYAKKDFATVNQLLEIYGNAGIIDPNTLANIAGSDITSGVTPYPANIDETNIQTTLQSEEENLANTQIKINNEVNGVLRNLMASNPSEFVDGNGDQINLVDVLQKDYEVNGVKLSQLPPQIRSFLGNSLDLEKARTFLTNRGGYEELVDNIDNHLSNVANLSQVKSGVVQTIIPQLDQWFRDSAPWGRSKTINIGNTVITEDSGKYYVYSDTDQVYGQAGPAPAGTKYISGTGTNRGLYSAKEISREGILDLLNNQALNTDSDISFVSDRPGFNNNVTIPSSQLKKLATDQYKSNIEPLRLNRQRYDLLSNTPSSVLAANEIAQYMLGRPDMYGDFYNNLNLMASPEGFKGLLENTAKPDKEGNKPTLPQGLGLIFDPSGNGVIPVKIENGKEVLGQPIPFSGLPNGTAIRNTMIQINQASNSIIKLETQGKTLQNLTLQSPNGIYTKPVANRTYEVGPLGNKVNLDISLNVTSTLNDRNTKDFTFTPSIQLNYNNQVQTLNYEYIAKYLSRIDPNITPTSLLFKDYKSAYGLLTNLDGQTIMNMFAAKK